MEYTKIICEVRSDIEFFTRVSDGISGMSIRGLALACGVDESSMRQVLNLRGKEQPKWAKSIDIKWIEPAGQISKNGGECRIVHADTCAEIIEHYAFDNRVQAQNTLRSFLTLGIHTFIQKITGWKPQQKQQISPTTVTPTVEPSIEEIEKVFAPLYRLGIKKGLIESAKLSSIATSIPRLEASVENAKQLISAALKTEEVPVSPTKLGVIFANNHKLEKPPSGQKVNQALLAAGFQFKDEDKNWQLTESGKKYGQQQFETARKKNKTIVVVRWLPSVLEEIDKYLEY